MARGAKAFEEVRIEESLFPNTGMGYGLKSGRYYGIKQALPGALVMARRGRKRDGYVEGKLVEVLEPSPLITEGGCVHREVCGGCSYQGLSYERELQLKHDQLALLFARAGVELGDFPIIPSPSTEAYRNKMEYTFGDEYRDGPMSLGHHRRGRFYDIISTDHCLIVHEDMNRIRQEVLAFAQASGEDYFHRRSHEGLWRHLGVRRSETTGNLLVNIVTTSMAWDRKGLVDRLMKLDLQGKIQGILHTENNSVGDAIIPEKVEVLYGEDLLEEEMMGLKFRLSTYSFFQTNTRAAEVLYGKVQEMARGKTDGGVMDLYSGTGTMTQLMGQVADQVLGVEIVEDAVMRARESAKLNLLDKVEFICGDVKEVLQDLEERPELIIVDPPREGVHPKGIELIKAYGPRDLIMVSCNPKTLARDLQGLLEDYTIIDAVAVDQFPRTNHCEMVVLMSRTQS